MVLLKNSCQRDQVIYENYRSNRVVNWKRSSLVSGFEYTRAMMWLLCRIILDICSRSLRWAMCKLKWSIKQRRLMKFGKFYLLFRTGERFGFEILSRLAANSNKITSFLNSKFCSLRILSSNFDRNTCKI